jgi:phosphatidylinositol-3-phosphatase
MLKKAAALCLSSLLLASTLPADEGRVPSGVAHLDHVFVIMMENHAYKQIIDNPNEPFVNQYAKSANMATNYFAVAHPSLTNYLEIVGGSNFGILNDDDPDWHNATCSTQLQIGAPLFDVAPFPPVCPIDGTGTDAATPAVDFTNEASSPAGINNIDGHVSIPAAKNTIGKTIADQLSAAGLTWKSYQESLPPAGADNVNYSDGFFSNLVNPTTVMPNEKQGVIKQYAAKHNPFVYFRSIQEGGLNRVVGFEGAHGLFEDLSSGRVPAFSFIAPNQCNDQHGRGNAGPLCDFDPSSDGTQNGLNPGLIYQGDLTVRNLVKSIKSSPAWEEGRNAIVLVWDENDYSNAPNTNQVVLIVDTNYGVHGVRSANFYTHFSLLKSLEAGFGLPCLNHACDDSTKVMSDLFGAGEHQGE